MGNIKVLELPFYAKYEEFWDAVYDTPCEPILHRSGIYFMRSPEFCWLEYENGAKAVLYDVEMFKYELSMLNHRPLTVAERMAILLLIRSKLQISTSKQLKELYYLDTCWREHREVARETAKYMLRFNKEWAVGSPDMLE